MAHVDDGLDAEEFFILRDELYQDVYAAQHDQMRQDDIYYNLEYAVQVPDNKPILKPMTARIAVDTADAHIITDFPRIKVPRRKTRSDGIEKAQAQAEMARSFYETHLYMARLGTSRTDPISKARKNMLLRGKAALMTYPNPEIISKEWADEYSDRELDINRWPILLESPDPLSFMEDPDSDPPQYVLLMKNMRYHTLMGYDFISDDARDSLQKQLNSGRGRFAYTTVWEYWTPNRVQWFDESTTEMLWDYEHGWGEHPFSIAFSGYGLEKRDMSDTMRVGSRRAEWGQESLSVGLLTHLVKSGVLNQEALTASQVASMMTDAAWVNYLLDDRIDQQFAPGSGMVYPIKREQGERAEDMVAPVRGVPPDPSLFAYLQGLQQESFAATAPKAVQGIHEPGVNAAAHAAQNSAAARLRYGSPLFNMQRLLSMSCSKAAYYHEHVIKKPITVFAGMPTAMNEITIKGDDWDGFYFNEVILQTSDTGERDQRILTGERLITTYGMDPVMIAESHGGIDNPQEQWLEAAAKRLIDAAGADILKKSLEEMWAIRKAEIDQEMGITPDQLQGLVPQPGMEGLVQEDAAAVMNEMQSFGTNSGAPQSLVQMDRNMRRTAQGPPDRTGQDLPPMAPTGGYGG